jgi:hypothetical protein
MREALAQGMMGWLTNMSVWSQLNFDGQCSHGIGRVGTQVRLDTRGKTRCYWT